MITSNRGHCGGFNSNVSKGAQAEIDADCETPVVITVGQKCKDYFEKRGYEICDEFLTPPESVTFLQAKELVIPIIEKYNNKEIDEVMLISTEFKSAMEQEVRVETILPFKIEKNPDINKVQKRVDYEPSVDVVFNYLIPKYVEMKVYSAIVESAACEHAARRMAMENATDNAREMLDTLNLNYNRARQSAITNEIIEIVAGSEAQN